MFIKSGYAMLAASVLLFVPAAFASQNFNFQHYSIRQGLPQTQVRVIHQDSTGYLWVGTYGGLGRYDGRGFRSYTTDDGLTSNTIEAITHTADGRVWAGTTNGLCYLEPGADRFQCINAGGLGDAHIQALLTTADNGLWVGTNRGLYRLAGNSVTTRLDADVTALAGDGDDGIWIGTRNRLLHGKDGAFSQTALPAGSGSRVRSLLWAGGTLWIGTVSGLYRMSNGTVQLAPGLPDDWALDDVNGIAVDGNGAIWAATNQGVLLQGKSGFELLTMNSGLKSEITFTVFTDRDGVIWLGNDDGLSKYTPGPFTGYTEANGLLHYFVRTINEDADGRLWLGTRAGAQIVPYENGEWRFDRTTTITADDGLVDTRVYSIDLISPHEAWLATGDGVVHWREDEGVVGRITREDGLPDKATQVLLRDGARLWIGTNHGVRVLENGAIRLPPDPALADAYVYRICKDPHGRLWFGSQDHGLFMLATNGVVKHFGAAEGVTDESIWDIAPDPQGGVWVGSNGDGLFHIDASGNIARYTTADGMVDNFIWQVLVDRHGRVWGYTNHGITRFDGQHFQNYGIEDGLLNLEGGATGAWESHDGSLWFASADGLMRYDEEREHLVVTPPKVVIQNVSIGNRSIVPGEVLPYHAGSLTFHFAALSFQNEEQLRYSYRLRGADEQWSEPLAYRPVTFANLGGGDYVFEVRARNQDGEWSPASATFSFRIAPPYWATVWFWVAVALAILLLAWAAFRVRIRQMHAHQRELVELVADRTRELEAANEKLRAASVTDPLTGLRNRRFLASQIRTDVAQSRRAYHGPTAFPNRDIVFMMIDLDHFKEINDTYGHNAGDRVLKQYAELLDRQMRESDYVVRWGGEEFLMVARHTEAKQCQIIASRVIENTRDHLFEIDDKGTRISCTCSIGVSHFPFLRQNPDALNWEQVIDISDIAVYMAKSCGRNGWVAIQGNDELKADDAPVIMQRVREDLCGMVDRGFVSVTSSFADPLSAAPINWQNKKN